jgi:hypothetical protein
VHAHSLLLLVVLGALAGAVALACDDEPSEAEQEAALCAEIADLRSAIAGLGDLGLGSSREDVRTQLDEISDRMDDVREAARPIGEARLDDLEAANEDLQDAVEAIGGDEPLGDQLQAVADAGAAVGEALVALAAVPDCEANR